MGARAIRHAILVITVAWGGSLGCRQILGIGNAGFSTGGSGGGGQPSTGTASSTGSGGAPSTASSSGGASSTAGPGGTTSMGIGPTSSSTSSGGQTHACTDPTDRQALANHAATLLTDLDMCGLQSGNDAAALTACIENKEGISAACASCFTPEFPCGDMHCFSQCSGAPESAACSICLTQSCGAALAICTGLPPSWACADSADQALLGPTGGGALAQAQKCLKDNSGNDAAVQACIQAQTKLGALCVTCFDTFVTCAATTCAGACASPSAACSVCTQQSCAPAFASCSGDTTVNGCDPAITQATAADPIITFPMGTSPMLQYDPPCVKVTQGASVTWSGSFALFPLVGEGTGTPIPQTTTGTSVSVVFNTAGSFGFHSTATSSMAGAVFVVP